MFENYCQFLGVGPGSKEKGGLLHLAPNSPDAKVFEEFANRTGSTPATNGNTTSNGSGAEINSDGGRGNRWSGIDQMAWAVLITVVFDMLPNL
ncbi:hypothetical protein F0562_001343 [Nyssa sinensis]|uniref:Uncharacterized protein n=1 Tax=Nyssa sinensis TaxID=561372 RepID=A0A5J5C374_9ASTE|nr:hypothetical protein F0562_001343 [Nyssa sinensis]